VSPDARNAVQQQFNPFQPLVPYATAAQMAAPPPPPPQA